MSKHKPHLVTPIAVRDALIPDKSLSQAPTPQSQTPTPSGLPQKSTATSSGLLPKLAPTSCGLAQKTTATSDDLLPKYTSMSRGLSPKCTPTTRGSLQKTTATSRGLLSKFTPTSRGLPPKFTPTSQGLLPKLAPTSCGLTAGSTKPIKKPRTWQLKKTKKLLTLIALTLSLTANATQNEEAVFTSIDQPKFSNNPSLSATGFSASSNSADVKDDDEDLNIHLKSKTHMGDVLSEKLPIFGQNLFGNQCNQVHQAHFFNPEYRVAVGDEINLQMWGAFQFSEKLGVDSQGNIFIPEVGPVKVEGVENQKLNDIVQQNVKKTFKQGVNVYADLITAQPVQVYVTGFINSPGLYDGLSSDSVIYFLCAAGGINLQEGSFRDIDILRGGRKIRHIDLYDFLLNGNITPFQLHQGDTIVVKPQKYVISVAGDVKKPYQYELTRPSAPLSSLIKLANVEPTATYVRIQRNQGMKPTFHYQKLSDAKAVHVQSSDHITFVADKEVQQSIVTVKGQVKGPHQYIVKQGTNVGDFLKTVHLAPDANILNTQLFRESVAKQQKDALNASLSRLKRQTMTGESLTGDDAKIQATRSELIMKFVQEAKEVATKGQVVLGPPSKWQDIRLENNDVINIPPKTSVVTISGDVVNALSMNVNPQYRLKDYIEAAGGFQKTANQKEFLLMHQNGEVQLVKNNSKENSRVMLKGGDQLVVLPRETENGIKVTGMMTSILYQLAIAARVAMRI